MARILIVDDDAAVRALVAEILRSFGHVVIAAGDGEEGIRLFPEARPDLVITDIVMPEREGLEMMAELHRLQPGVKIIAISGGARSGPGDYLELARYLGARKVLAKPFTQAALMAAVDELLAGT
jgi:CheY-like chemotaxis protein